MRMAILNRFPAILLYCDSTRFCVASQAVWYRMENGPKSKNVKKYWPKNRNGPRPEMGNKWPKNGKKMGFGIIFLFFAIFGPFFPYFGARAIFYFCWPFFSHFGFRPVFHSIPGGLTRNFCASRCGISGDSGPAILGIVRFAIRDSVPLSPDPKGFRKTLPKKRQGFFLSRNPKNLRKERKNGPKKQGPSENRKISSCVLGFFARGFSRKCLHWRGNFWKKFLWDLQEKITSEHRKTQNKALRRGSWTTPCQRPLFSAAEESKEIEKSKDWRIRVQGGPGSVRLRLVHGTVRAVPVFGSDGGSSQISFTLRKFKKKNTHTIKSVSVSVPCITQLFPI